MASNTAKLKEGLRKAFVEFYDEETAETLADVHVSYHIRFAMQLTDAKGPGMDPDGFLNSRVNDKLKARVRRARRGDVLPAGPKTEALMDEIVDFIKSAQTPSMSEIQNVAGALGSEPEIVRTAVARLVKAGRVERVGGTGKDNKNARYTCSS